MDSKDLLSLLKEPLFFDDWVAANFKAINLPSDWLAARQSPYQILGGDPGAVRQSAEIAQRGGVGRARRRRDQKEREREGERERKLGSFSSSSRRPHASAVPRRLPFAPGAVAMAAVAVLRNDSLQAFLQVSTRTRCCSNCAGCDPHCAGAAGVSRFPPGAFPGGRPREVGGDPRGGRRPGSGFSGL